MSITKSQLNQFDGDNILRTYEQATDEEFDFGCSWYLSAHNICLDISAEYNVSPSVVTGMLAALSPRNKWERNIDDVCNLLADDDAKVATFGTNRDKALTIKYYDDDTTIIDLLGGDKVRSFYGNIHNPNDANIVTLDGHAIAIWLGSRVVGASAKGKAYQTISQHYIDAAIELEILPNQLQAVTWLVYKRLNGI